MIVENYNVKNTIREEVIIWSRLEKMSDLRDVTCVSFSGCGNKTQMITIIDMFLKKCVNIRKIDLTNSCADQIIYHSIKAFVSHNVSIIISSHVIWTDLNILSDLNLVNSISFEGCNDIKRMYNIIENYVSLCKNLKQVDLSNSFYDGNILSLLAHTCPGVEIIHNENYMVEESSEHIIPGEYVSESVHWYDVWSIDNKNLDCVKFVSFYGCNDIKMFYDVFAYISNNFKKVKMLDIRNSSVAVNYLTLVLSKNKMIEHIIVDDENLKNYLANFVNPIVLSNTFTIQEILDFDISFFKGIKLNIVDSNFNMFDDEKLFQLMVQKLRINGFTYHNINRFDFQKNDQMLYLLMRNNLVENAGKDKIIICNSIQNVFNITQDQLYRVIAIYVESSANSDDISRLIQKYLPLCVNLKFLFFHNCNVEMSHIIEMNELIDKVKYIQINSSNLETNEVIDCARNGKNIGVYSFEFCKKINNPIFLHELHDDVVKFLNEDSVVDVMLDYVSDKTIDRFFDNLRKYNVNIGHINFVGLTSKFNYNISNVASININDANIENFNVLSNYIKNAGRVFAGDSLVIYVDSNNSIQFICKLLDHQNEDLYIRVHKSISVSNVIKQIPKKHVDVVVVDFEQISSSCYKYIESLNEDISCDFTENIHTLRIRSFEEIDEISEDFLDGLFNIFSCVQHFLCDDNVSINVDISKYNMETLVGYISRFDLACLSDTLKSCCLKIDSHAHSLRVDKYPLHDIENWSIFRSTLRNAHHWIFRVFASFKKLKKLHVGSSSDKPIISSMDMCFDWKFKFELDEPDTFANLTQIKLTKVNLSNIELVDLPKLEIMIFDGCYTNKLNYTLRFFTSAVSSNKVLKELHFINMDLLNIDLRAEVISMFIRNCRIINAQFLFGEHFNIINIYFINVVSQGLNLKNVTHVMIDDLHNEVSCLALYLNLPKDLETLSVINSNVELIYSLDDSKLNKKLIEFNTFNKLLSFSLANNMYVSNISKIIFQLFDINSIKKRDILLSHNMEIYSIANMGAVEACNIQGKFAIEIWTSKSSLFVNHTLKELNITDVFFVNKFGDSIYFAELFPSLQSINMKNFDANESDIVFGGKNLKSVFLQGAVMYIRFEKLISANINVHTDRVVTFEVFVCKNVKFYIKTTSINFFIFNGSNNINIKCDIEQITSFQMRDTIMTCDFPKLMNIHSFKFEEYLEKKIVMNIMSNTMIKNMKNFEITSKNTYIHGLNFIPSSHICNIVCYGKKNWQLIPNNIVNQNTKSIKLLECHGDIDFSDLKESINVHELRLNEFISLPTFKCLKRMEFDGVYFFSFEKISRMVDNKIEIIIKDVCCLNLHSVAYFSNDVKVKIHYSKRTIPVLINVQNLSRSKANFKCEYEDHVGVLFPMLLELHRAYPKVNSKIRKNTDDYLYNKGRIFRTFD